MDRLIPWNFEYGPGPIAPEFELPPGASWAVVRYEEVNANIWRRILNSNALLLLMWLALMICGTIVFAITSLIVNVDKTSNPDAVTAQISSIATSLTATLSMDMTATTMEAITESPITLLTTTLPTIKSTEKLKMLTREEIEKSLVQATLAQLDLTHLPNQYNLIPMPYKCAASIHGPGNEVSSTSFLCTTRQLPASSCVAPQPHQCIKTRVVKDDQVLVTWYPCWTRTTDLGTCPSVLTQFEKPLWEMPTMPPSSTQSALTSTPSPLVWEETI